MKRTPAGAALPPLALLVLALLPPCASSLEAQGARTRSEENFRAEPNGILLGIVEAGTVLSDPAPRDRWVEATLEGWMWAASLQTTAREDYGLVVAEPAGENLRERPSGEIVARIEEGTLLEELERTTGWIRVRRRGWIWEASVEIVAEASPGSGPARAAEAPAGGEAGSRLATGPAGAAVLAAPDGDTLARALPRTDVRVVGREGNWLRVTIDGWVWSPPGVDAALVEEEPVEATPLQVAQDGEAFRGRIVRWQLQFISLERAERIRTDFYEGEPFLLTRPVEGGEGFVYVAVPPESLAAARGLLPLETVLIVGRVRTGRSALTGSPILDLVELIPPGHR